MPIPEVEPEGVLIRVTHANICGSDLHFWRGDAPLRLPEDGWIFGHEMTGRVARLGAKVKTDSLGSPAQGGRPRRLHLLLSVRALLRVPARGAGRLPEQDRAPARPERAAAPARRLRRSLLPAPRRRPLRGAGRALRRGGGGRELRALPGLLRPARGRRAARRPRGHPGRGRPRHPGRRGGQGHGRRDRDRGRPDPGPARAGARLRGRPHHQRQGGARPARAGEAGAPVDGRRRAPTWRATWWASRP